jgi:hypothetical protein
LCFGAPTPRRDSAARASTGPKSASSEQPGRCEIDRSSHSLARFAEGEADRDQAAHLEDGRGGVDGEEPAEGIARGAYGEVHEAPQPDQEARDDDRPRSVVGDELLGPDAPLLGPEARAELRAEKARQKRASDDVPEGVPEHHR